MFCENAGAVGMPPRSPITHTITIPRHIYFECANIRARTILTIGTWLSPNPLAIYSTPLLAIDSIASDSGSMPCFRGIRQHTHMVIAIFRYRAVALGTARQMHMLRRIIAMPELFGRRFD